MQKNLAMAYVDPQHTAEGSVLEVSLLGQAATATVCKPCLFDPGNALSRGAA